MQQRTEDAPIDMNMGAVRFIGDNAVAGRFISQDGLFL
jgi:hypothetical protein